MSDMMNDPKSGALEPIRTEALDTARPPAQQLRWNARATHRAMEGWQRVKSQEDWERINEESRQQYESGAFLLERLGADRYLDPTLMANVSGRLRGLRGNDVLVFEHLVVTDDPTSGQAG